MTQIIHTEKAPAAIGPYVQAVDLGNLVLTSGQIPVNPATGEVPADIVAQARQSLESGFNRRRYCKNDGFCERS